MTCTVEQRQNARDCATACLDEPAVVAADALDPATDPTDRWTVELVLCVDGVPPAVSRLLSLYDLTIRDVSPQRDQWRAVAVA